MTERTQLGTNNNGLGDRLSVNGVHYTLDINSGLTQVLADGTNTYTYGLGRISQTDTSTEYFLGDALGSVRQLTADNGDVTLSKAYDPYGVITTAGGTSQTVYGFTGEYQGDSTELIYLRARYYNPLDGRFQSRDTWGGNYNRPLSLNKWMYTEGNPVNLTDPSGNFPIQCQQMPTKATYATCVLQYYDLEPIAPNNMESYVEGSTGCYLGPTEYRAPGYFEGIGVLFQSLFGFGGEVVYDFASFERANMKYGGGGIHSMIVGVSLSEYVGTVNGFRVSVTDPFKHGIKQDYTGESVIWSGGISASVGLGFALGCGGFYSVNDPLIRGSSCYLSGSLGADDTFMLPISPDFSVMRVMYDVDDKRGDIRPYVLEGGRGLVDSAAIFNDIQSGVSSPLRWYGLLADPAVYIARQNAVIAAAKYLLAYEEIKFQKILH